MSWLYTLSNPFDFQGGRTDDVDSIVYGDLGTAQGLFSALYDGWSVIHRKLLDESLMLAIACKT